MTFPESVKAFFTSRKNLSYMVYAAMMLGIAWVVFTVRRTLIPFAVGSIIAYIIYPVVRWIDNTLAFVRLPKSPRRIIAILLVYVILISLIALFVTFVSRVFTGQLANLIEQFNKGKDLLIKTLGIQPNEDAEIAPNDFVNELSTTFNLSFQDISMQFFHILRDTVTTTMEMLIVLFWMFYLLYSPRKLIDGILAMFPIAWRKDVSSMGDIVNKVVSRYIRGQLVLCFTIGFLIYLSLTILGFPFAIPLGIIAGFFEAIPVVGPIVGAIPAVLISFTISSQAPYIVIILYTLMYKIDNSIILPRIQGKNLSIPPVLVVLLVVIGASLGGVIGALIAIPFTAATRDVIHYILLRLDEEKSTPKQVKMKVLKEEFTVDML
ncbi:MAG: AI-2E family transporter [bacterium]